MKRQNGISKMKSINMGDDKKEEIMVEETTGVLGKALEVIQTLTRKG